MRDFAVHEEPKVGGPRGLRRLILPVRRLLCRVLRPVFVRLADLLRDLDGDQRRLAERQDRLGEQVDALLNRGWDQAALLRRVAALEQQVDQLRRSAAEADDPAATNYYVAVEEAARPADRRGRAR
jgi:hypothetical protein